MDLSIVRQARETLAGALAASQEAGDSPAADALAGQLAQAVGALFTLEKEVGGTKQSTRVAKALAALTEIAEALPRTGLPSAVRRRIEEATSSSRALLEGAIRSEAPAQRRPAPAPVPAPVPAATPVPRQRRPSAVPPAVRTDGAETIIETDVGFVTESNFFVGFAGDLSDGGLFVSTWQTLPVGTAVTIVFTLPDGHQARARGQVMWVREADETAADAAPGIGVTLDGLTDRDMKSVGSFMSKRTPIFHPG